MSGVVPVLLDQGSSFLPRSDRERLVGSSAEVRMGFAKVNLYLDSLLKETGVGKTVNGLRKHELVGDFAKNLVARWKKLVPVSQEADR